MTTDRAQAAGVPAAGTPSAPRAEVREPLGGDPACWLDRVCDACGRFIDDPLADHCPLCGAPHP